MKRFLADQDGATSIEYAVLAAMISLAIFAAIGGLGDTISSSYQDTASKVQEATNR